MLSSKYLIHGYVKFAISGVGHRLLSIRGNGSAEMVTSSVPAVSTGEETNLSVATHATLNAGEYVELMVRQTSGAPLLIKSSGGAPSFGMVKLP